MKHKDRVRIKFGKTDLDNLAQVIYDEFHGHDAFSTGYGPPWKLYSKEKHDVVVEEFRTAAEAAILAFNDGDLYEYDF